MEIPREYQVGEVVRYRPHHPGEFWDDERWWVCAKIVTEAWGRPATTFYHVARVADPGAVWRVDTCVRADMLAPAEAPAGFHLPPRSA